MKKVLLLDYQEDLSQPIRKAVTGTFGSKTEVNGIMGKMYMRMKAKGIIIPPLYFAYAASIFENENWEITHKYKFDDKKYDLIIFATSMPGHLDEVAAIKEYRKNHSTSIVVAGAFSKERPKLFHDLVEGIIIDGEPELNFIKIAKGETVLDINKPELRSGQVENPDDLPFPGWKHFGYTDFQYSPMLKGIAVPFLTSRGCPYNCDYCHYMPEAGPKARFRSLDKVIEEIKYLKELGINNIVFRDLVFTLNIKRTIELCERMISEKLNISWAIETRIDKLTPELIDIMKKAGLKHLNLGVESPDPKILKNVGRLPADLVHQESIINHIQDTGLTISAFYIIGFIEDDHTSVMNMINYAKKVNSLAAQFCVMTPFPGTKLYDDLKDRITTTNWSDFTEYNPTLKLDNLSAAEVVKYRDLAYKKYYMRPSWVLKYIGKILG